MRLCRFRLCPPHFDVRAVSLFGIDSAISPLSSVCFLLTCRKWSAFAIRRPVRESSGRLCPPKAEKLHVGRIFSHNNVQIFFNALLFCNYFQILCTLICGFLPPTCTFMLFPDRFRLLPLKGTAYLEENGIILHVETPIFSVKHQWIPIFIYNIIYFHFKPL